MNKRHILLTGKRGVGKSTIVQKLLASWEGPVSGFVTKRLAADETGFHPIYIHPAGLPFEAHRHSPENLIGTCDTRTHNVVPEVFDGLGVQYLSSAVPGSLIVMDELGFMETQATLFLQEVMNALDQSDIPVLAVVKDREDIRFLNAVRAHRNGILYTVTPENRDALPETILPLLRTWQDPT